MNRSLLHVLVFISIHPSVDMSVFVTHKWTGLLSHASRQWRPLMLFWFLTVFTVSIRVCMSHAAIDLYSPPPAQPGQLDVQLPWCGIVFEFRWVLRLCFFAEGFLWAVSILLPFFNGTVMNIAKGISLLDLWSGVNSRHWKSFWWLICLFIVTESYMAWNPNHHNAAVVHQIDLVLDFHWQVDHLDIRVFSELALLSESVKTLVSM